MLNPLPTLLLFPLALALQIGWWGLSWVGRRSRKDVR